MRRQHDIEADTVKGAGAAGGIGAGLIAFLQAELQRCACGDPGGGFAEYRLSVYLPLSGNDKVSASYLI
jgi:hypothetical protein